MKKTNNLHIRTCDELEDYLSNFESRPKGVYEWFHTHRDLKQALKDGGLEALEPADLVGLIRCLVNDKKRLTIKRGA